jgi:excisionase family DNA binding protein
MVVNMKTLTLQEAASLLKMTPEGSRVKATKGEVPGAKPGKRWVFSEDDLAEYLRSLYPNNAKLLQGAMESDRRKLWHCTKEVIRGGLKSAKMEEDYNKALARQTK